MHYSVLIIGPDPGAQMEPYSERLEVEPYLGECLNCGGDPKYQPCERCDNLGKEMRTDNPQGRWDYWRVGGRWANLLVLKPGATGSHGESRWDSEPPEAGTADQALRGAIDLPATLGRLTHGEDAGTFALVAEGVWRARRTWDGETFVEDPHYHQLWRRMVEGLADNVLLTIGDFHS